MSTAQLFMGLAHLPVWTEAQCTFIGYSPSQLAEVVRAMYELIELHEKGVPKLKAVKKKFAFPKFQEVSKYTCKPPIYCGPKADVEIVSDTNASTVPLIESNVLSSESSNEPNVGSDRTSVHEHLSPELSEKDIHVHNMSEDQEICKITALVASVNVTAVPDINVEAQSQSGGCDVTSQTVIAKRPSLRQSWARVVSRMCGQ